MWEGKSEPGGMGQVRPGGPGFKFAQSNSMGGGKTRDAVCQEVARRQRGSKWQRGDNEEAARGSEEETCKIEDV